MTELVDGKAHNLAIVAHGRVISLLVSRAAGLDAYELWLRLGLPSFVVLDLATSAVIEVVESI